MRCSKPLSFLLVNAVCGALSAQPTTATFIGNCAFRIDFADWILYSDFPYQSGYSGYNTYELPGAFNAAKGTALITHAHLDHFDSSLFRSCRLELIAPWLSETAMTQEMERMQGRGIYVYPIPTPHAELPHNSYIVARDGRRLYFTGDTEDPSYLLKAVDIDVAFVTPWLIAAINAKGGMIDARTVIMYHHEKGEFDGREVKAPCRNCRLIIPQQGEVIELFR